MISLNHFPLAATTYYHKLGGLNNRNVMSHHSGDQKFEIKVSAGSILSEDYKEHYVPCLFQTSFGVSTILVVPCLLAASP